MVSALIQIQRLNYLSFEIGCLCLRVFFAFSTENEIRIFHFVSTKQLKLFLGHDLFLHSDGFFVFHTLSDRPIVIQKLASDKVMHLLSHGFHELPKIIKLRLKMNLPAMLLNESFQFLSRNVIENSCHYVVLP
jgi:hypothetical protein